MAKQQPQQPYIPRVAGAPPPQPQPYVQAPAPVPVPSQRAFTEAPAQSSSGGSFRMLARYCWLSVLVAMLVGIALGNLKSPSREVNLASSVLLGLLWLSGILSGIIALFGIPRHGRKGILAPALVGLFLWMGMIALAVFFAPVFNKIQERALALKAAAAETSGVPAGSTPNATSKPGPIDQTPPAYPEGWTRVEDKELGFSFAVPGGYAVTTGRAPDELHSFYRKFFTEPTRILSVKKFSGDFSRRVATAEDLPPPGPGQTSESAVFDWRGRNVGGTRSVDASRNPPYLVFRVVVPLHKQRIMLEIGGAADYEPVILETVDQVLGSLVEEASSSP